MDKLYFDPKGVRQNGHVYTTLTHVKDIKSLYLLYKLQQTNFTLSEKVATKLRRLRENHSYQLEYSLYPTQIEYSLTILSLNTHSFSLYFEDIVTNYNLMNTNILCFQ